MTKHMGRKTMPYDGHAWTIVFWCQRPKRNFNGVTPTGCQLQVKGNRPFLTDISLYLRNGA